MLRQLHSYPSRQSHNICAATHAPRSCASPLRKPLANVPAASGGGMRDLGAFADARATKRRATDLDLDPVRLAAFALKLGLAYLRMLVAQGREAKVVVVARVLPHCRRETSGSSNAHRGGRGTGRLPEIPRDARSTHRRLRRSLPSSKRRRPSAAHVSGAARPAAAGLKVDSDNYRP